MPGWESLDTVARLHGAAQITGLLLLLLLAGAVLLFLQLRRGTWPEWIDVGSFQVRSVACEIAAGALLALLTVTGLVAYAYGARQHTLIAAAEQTYADQLRRVSDDAKARQADEEKEKKARRAAENTSQQKQQLRELTELRIKLGETESQLTELQRKQMQKRLSEDEKRLLIEALTPFAGQRVAVAASLGDDESKTLAEDFVAVFDAAGWDHGGDDGISVQRWDRDPVGIEVTLNESDARAGRISVGIGALINAVRKLGLVYDNTVYMNREVPSGQALVKVGKKLRK
jgi:hypothetical protein